MSSKIKNLFGSSRLVLPEQREAYLQYRVDEKLVPMPILESDEIASMPIVMN